MKLSSLESKIGSFLSSSFPTLVACFCRLLEVARVLHSLCFLCSRVSRLFLVCLCVCVCVCVFFFFFCSASSFVAVSVFFFWFFFWVGISIIVILVWRTLLLHCDHVCFAERHLCCLFCVYVQVVL